MSAGPARTTAARRDDVTADDFAAADFAADDFAASGGSYRCREKRTPTGRPAP